MSAAAVALGSLPAAPAAPPRQDQELEALIAKVRRVMPDGSPRDWYLVAEIIRRSPSFPD